MGLFNSEDKLTVLTGGLNKRIQSIFGERLTNVVFPNHSVVLGFLDEDETPEALVAEVSVHIHPDDYVEEGFARQIDALRDYMEIYYDIPVDIRMVFS